ncbi:kynurenine 3-monooxygenase [Aspergillus stella-maris]|uniref:kynurenine 3-monooxygenase n=1 Tax=Aspergillus stella-maris TaxID=1810926 RepID=UPI003CCD5D2F
MAPPAKQKVVIVGAGPVGCLAALYAAARGDDVEVYELRDDLRVPGTVPLNFTKSINLSLSHRGITAIEGSNQGTVIQEILREVVPLYGRMIHGRDNGKLWEAPQAYDVHGRHNLSADRSMLSNVFLNALESLPNIKLFFNHKLTGADFNSNKAWFERRQPGDTPLPGSSGRVPEIEVCFDFLIGADGAHSATRYHMMKFSRVDYQQEYIDTLWCEFRIPPGPDNNFMISPSHLHIWPGKEFMFIALPSTDKSFTCTLFAPASHYATLEISTPQQLLKFFDEHFPGVCPNLISESDLVSQFNSNPHLPLISIKCSPHHYSSSVVIVGDAAHAVLPFYGQGLNAGLEDIQVLFDCLDKHGVYSNDASYTTSQSRTVAREKAIAEYTATRTADTHAINDLSRQNYLEMRWAVNRPLYKVRKAIEELLYHYLPNLGWQTQYTRVSFSNQRYSEIVRVNAWQGEILGGVLGGSVCFAAVAVGVLGWRREGSFGLGLFRGVRDVLGGVVSKLRA